MSDKVKELFGRRVAFLLAQKGKTQLDMARALGVATGTVSSWVNGQKFPRVDAMERIAEFLGVRLSTLTDEDGMARYFREEEEQRLVAAYRAADPGTQAAVRKLLDLPEEKDAAARSAM